MEKTPTQVLIDLQKVFEEIKKDTIFFTILAEKPFWHEADEEIQKHKKEFILVAIDIISAYPFNQWNEFEEEIIRGFYPQYKTLFGEDIPVELWLSGLQFMARLPHYVHSNSFHALAQKWAGELYEAYGLSATPIPSSKSESIRPFGPQKNMIKYSRQNYRRT